MMNNVRMYIDVDVAAGSENSGTFVCALAGGTLLTGSSTDRLKNENCCIVSFSTIVRPAYIGVWQRRRQKDRQSLIVSDSGRVDDRQTNSDEF